MNHHPQFQKLIVRARHEAPLPAAVVYPCDRDSVQLAFSGEFAGYLALGMAAPKVGLLAAMDGASPAFPSTAEALALKEMAAQGVIAGAVVDGPFTPETALSADAARNNGVRSEVAGRVDVLIAPGMEAAVMVLKTLQALTHGLAAGLVLGAKVPIVVPARG